MLFSLTACSVTHHMTVNYNHVTHEVRVKDSLVHPNFFDVNRQMDDEFEVVMYEHQIKELKVLHFFFDKDYNYRVGRVYFYSPFMSNYMQDNEWFTFEVAYKNRRK